MLQVIRKIYRSIVPQELRRNRALQQWEIKKQKLRGEILAYYNTVDPSTLDSEMIHAVEHLRTNPLQVFPHAFAGKYNVNDINVLHDDARNMPYVLFDGKRLYYKKEWSNARIKEYHNGLLQEQDDQSPHRYLTKSFDVSSEDVVVDVGAAEGIFALSVVEKAKRVYLFEADESWSNALRATFEPFYDKIEIIHQAVSDLDNDRHLTLDSFFCDRQIDFIKMDVDGGERAALRGAKNLLATKRSLKLALCAYHNQNDEAEFTELLQRNNFNVETSRGYMIFFYDKKLAPPFFRRGVLRAVKKTGVA